MAIHRSLVIFAIVVLMTPAISLATDFVVGDDDGWKFGIDYEDWAKGKQFFVGDTLVFKYNATVHNVCTVPSNNSLGSFTGNDTIKLATTGNKWYICGVNGHCDGGMKLKIIVLDGTAPAPSAASTLLATNFQIFLGMIFTITSIVIVY
ncbi:hypothetical protein ES332_A11G259600v1 [Gossypium tomentosum]|uniref:Phytocyanin domain-containing protein n=1 Tax=Gossypium tomentosum TaxID=34277 RepID=A0A5D2NFD0_GOSTO|nr:hypothetical protein ES332_A11G259600v1 [Gossypium tomentosum]